MKELKMSEKTKACNLTEAEIKTLINNHGIYASSDPDKRIDRMNYLNKRLKTFNEPEAVKHDAPSEKVGW